MGYMCQVVRPPLVTNCHASCFSFNRILFVVTGCKIKALRAKTNTYIKTPVRGEEPFFVVTGRREDVAMAKREILAAAEHFSQIRASRKASASQSPPITSPGVAVQPPTPFGGDNHITIRVRVPYRVVGLVVGPKGATVKRIQQLTNTYIITPSRDREPCFEVTGTPENVEIAKREIESYIALRTGGSVDGSSDDADYPLSPTGDINGSIVADPIYTSAAHHYSTLREAQMNRANQFVAAVPPRGGDGMYRSLSPSGVQAFTQFQFPKTGSQDDDTFGPGSHVFDQGMDPMAVPPRQNSSRQSGSIWSYQRGSFGGHYRSEASAFQPPRRGLVFDDAMRPMTLGKPLQGRGAFGRTVSEPYGLSTLPLTSPTMNLGPIGSTPDMSIPGLNSVSSGMSTKSNGTAILQQNGSVSSSSEGSSRQSQSPTENKAKECAQCSTREVVAALVPCGHNLWCMECAEDIMDDHQKCPMCMKDVISVLRIHQN